MIDSGPYRSSEITRVELSFMERLFMSPRPSRRVAFYILAILRDIARIPIAIFKWSYTTLGGKIVLLTLGSIILILVGNYVGEKFFGIKELGQLFLKIGSLLWLVYCMFMGLSPWLKSWFLSRYRDKMSAQIETKINEKGLLPPKLTDPYLSYSQGSRQESCQESQKED